MHTRIPAHEHEILSQLGFAITDDGRVIDKTAASELVPSNLGYCGFGMYRTQTGRVFEKTASGELIEWTTPETAAERRFVDRHLNRMQGV